MIRQAMGLALLLISNYGWAQDLVFKKEFMPSNNLLNFSLLTAGLAFIFILLKKKNKNSEDFLQNFSVQRKSLNSKTSLYLIQFQSQKFLLADNQQCLVIQELKENLPCSNQNNFC